MYRENFAIFCFLFWRKICFAKKNLRTKISHIVFYSFMKFPIAFASFCKIHSYKIFRSLENHKYKSTFDTQITELSTVSLQIDSIACIEFKLCWLSLSHSKVMICVISELPVYSLKEVSEHCEREDAWTVIYDKVGRTHGLLYMIR